MGHHAQECKGRAVGAGQAIARPPFGRSLGKGRQKSSCACATGIYSSILGLFVSDFIVLHTNYSSSHIIVGCEPHHHILASYRPERVAMGHALLHLSTQAT